MTRFKQFAFRLRALFRKEKLDADMAEEMRLHIEQRTERNLAAGLRADDARYAALKSFGGAEQIKERARDARGWRWVDQIRRDCRYAARQLRRSPMFAFTTIASLALCLGLNAAIYSVLRALVLRPLPFAAAEEIVEVHSTGDPPIRLLSNVGQYLDYKANAPAFTTLALWDTGHDVLTDEVAATRLPTAVASPELFTLLQLQPLAGRFFGPEHMDKGNDKVLVLSESFWHSRFGGKSTAIGSALRLNGDVYRIIGVAPRAFEAFDARVKAIRPYSLRPDQLSNPSRTSFYVSLYGRIAPGVTLADAQAQVKAMDKNYYSAADARTRQFIDRTALTTLIDRVQDQRRGPLQTALWLLQAAAVFVLLIGAINVINLFLARGNARQREFLTRAALGASPRDLVQQLAIEAGMVGALGILGALALASTGLHLANSFAALLLPSALPFAINADVIQLTCAGGVALTVVIAILPTARVLWQTSAPSSQLNERNTSATRQARWIAGSLVVGQVAFTLTLVVSAALLLRSFLNVLAQEPGFSPEHVITARIDFRGEQEKTLPARIEVALRTVPGFDGCVATATPYLPVPGYPYGMGHSGTLSIANGEATPGVPLAGVFFCGVPADYARVMGLRIVQGRWFDALDIASGRAVVVDETFAQRFFPGQDPIGRRIARGSPKAPPAEWPEIIGVAGNVRHNGAEDRSGVPFAYFSREHVGFAGSASVLIRTSRSPEEAFAILRQLVRDLDPTIPVYAENTMEGVIADSMRGRQGIALTLGAFAGIALLLSAVGVFGVLAYDVSRRTREIGLRVALGASRPQIMGMIMRDGGQKAVAGVVAGLVIAAAANRFIASLLFDVAPTDFRAYAGSAALLVLVALLAAWLPARRAAKVDPIIALRCE